MFFDVVIIGASSSGLHAGRLLARSGLRVGIFERAARLEPPRRTYIVTPEFSEIVADLPAEALLNRIGVIRVVAGGGSVDVRLSDPDLIVERSLMMDWLLGETLASGAQIFFGHEFCGFRKQPQGVDLLIRDGQGQTRTVQAAAVIGADGMHSKTARAAGIPLPQVEPLVQAEVRLPAGWDPNLTAVWFRAGKTKYFYWLIPESDQQAVVGLIGDGRYNTRALLDDFLAEQGLVAERYQGARVAMHRPGLRPWGKVGSLPVYLVGDAAGQVKVTTVGGTVTGFMGARALATALIKKTSYARELRLTRRELDLHWGIRALLERLGQPGYERLVKVLNRRVIRFLEENNRDRMFPAFFRLLLEPQLLVLGFQALVRIFFPWRSERRVSRKTRRVLAGLPPERE